MLTGKWREQYMQLDVNANRIRNSGDYLVPAYMMAMAPAISTSPAATTGAPVKWASEQ